MNPVQINSGNSGGPAFASTGQCVGIAFQSLKHEDAENIGYIIPTPVIHHFITDYERNGAYTGFPCLGVEWQKMENPDLRTALKMKVCRHGLGLILQKSLGQSNRLCGHLMMSIVFYEACSGCRPRFLL